MFTDDQIELYAEKYFEVPALIRKRHLTFSMFLDLKMHEWIDWYEQFFKKIILYTTQRQKIN